MKKRKDSTVVRCVLTCSLCLSSGALAYAQADNTNANATAQNAKPTSPAAAKPSFGVSLVNYVTAYNVIPGTVAERAGLQPADIIAKVNGVSLRNVGPEIFIRVVQSSSNNKPLSMLVFSNGKPLVLTANFERNPNKAQPRLGVEIKTGIVIDNVIPGSTAQRVGLQPFDIITHANDKLLKDANAFVGFIENLPAGTPFSLRVQRSAESIAVPVDAITPMDATAPPTNAPQQPVSNPISADTPPSEELFKQLLQQSYASLADGYRLSPQKVEVKFDDFKVGEAVANLDKNAQGQLYRRNVAAADDASLYPLTALITVTETYADNQIYSYQIKTRGTAFIGLHRSSEKGVWWLQ